MATYREIIRIAQAVADAMAARKAAAIGASLASAPHSAGVPPHAVPAYVKAVQSPARVVRRVPRKLSYSPINDQVWNDALVGFAAGVFSRKDISGASTTLYNGVTAQAEVFAEAFDIALQAALSPGDGFPSTAQSNFLRELIENVVADKYSTDVAAVSFAPVIAAILSYAVPVFAGLITIAPPGGGLTQLTADVLAGPGTGSVAAEVVAARSGALTFAVGEGGAVTIDIPSGDALEITSEGVLQLLVGLTVGGTGANGGVQTGAGINLLVGTGGPGGGAGVLGLGFSGGANPTGDPSGDVLYVVPTSTDPAVALAGTLHALTSDGSDPAVGFDMALAPGVTGTRGAQSLQGGAVRVDIGTVPNGGGSFAISVSVPTGAAGRVTYHINLRQTAPGTAGGAVGDTADTILSVAVKNPTGTPTVVGSGPTVIASGGDDCFATNIAFALTGDADQFIFTITLDATAGNVEYQVLTEVLWN